MNTLHHGIVKLCGWVVADVPWVADRSAFVATSALPCVANVVLLSTNFMFVAMRSVTMFRSNVAASARLSSAVAISVVS